MKIVTQNFKSGDLDVIDAPAPSVKSGGVLVRVHSSLISIGTERAVIQLAKKNYLGKAQDRPDLARQVINKARTDGLWDTYKVVKNLISEPLPLGYSNVGEVIEVGANVTDVNVGDRVACAGLGYANHAEICFVPKNLFVKVPDNVPGDDAAYVTVGAIAMQGVRQADQQVGANILVVGLGLVGQIAAQICNAAGYRTIGMDYDARKNDLAVETGCLAAFSPDDRQLVDKIMALTDGFGVDAVLITAAAKDSGKVFDQVAELCRDRARVVVVGEAKMDMTRRYFFNKEIEILQSRSYGPGRYDTNYEEKGQDYPIGYVRWTQRRNMSSFIDLLAQNRLRLDRLTTHRFDIDNAKDAYDLVIDPPKGELLVGMLLSYPDRADAPRENVVPLPSRPDKSGKIRLGIIGTGKFARGILIPHFHDNRHFTIKTVASQGGLSAQIVKDKFRADKATTDIEDILKDDAIDAVVIATRPDTHYSFAARALKAGKHVYLEKPLCLTMEEAENLSALARDSGKIFTVGFNRRHSPFIKKMRDFYARRTEPLAMMYRANAGRIPASSKEGWVHDEAVGGGRLVSEACHFIDTMSYVCGELPVSVTATAVKSNVQHVLSSDIATLTVCFSGGSIGTVHYFANGDKSYPKEYMEVFGEEKIAILHNYRKLELIEKGSRKTTRSWISQQKGFAQEVEAFYDAIRTGVQPIAMDSLVATTAMTIDASAQIKR